MSSGASEYKSWPFVEAAKLLQHVGGKCPDKGYVLFETGYGPSGLPHLGTFQEVARTTMVRRAFDQLCKERGLNIPTKLFCVSDDVDGMRKIPDNLPNQEMLSQHLHKPLTEVPDPFGTHESYGHHMNARLRAFLDHYGFEYEFKSARELYKNGVFDDKLRLVAERFDKIMKIMLPTLGDERQQTYSPFLPISQKSGRVLYVPMKHVDAKAATITFDDEGEEVTLPITGGNVKLQWKPDFGMRWAALGVDFEMYGKDHLANGKVYSAICSALGGKPPVQFVYEMFLDKDGQKISKSKGNGLTIDEWLTYAPKESLIYYTFLSPNKAKRLHFDVIPKAMDEYLTFIKKYHEQSALEQKDNPAWHIHGDSVPKPETDLSFSLLLNLASACNPEDKSVLWGFISQYRPGISAEQAPILDEMAGFAVRYYHDFVKPAKQYRPPNDKERAALVELMEWLESLPLRGRLGEGSEMETDLLLTDPPLTPPSGRGLVPSTGLGTQDSSMPTPEDIQTKVYEIGTNHGFENLREWFGAMYEILLGQTQGPRMGSFIALYGLKKTADLIGKKILT